MLEVTELLGVADRSGIQQSAVAVLTLAHRVDLGLEFGDLGVEVLHGERHGGQPIDGGALLGLHLLVALLFGQMGGTVRETVQFPVQLGQFQQ